MNLNQLAAESFQEDREIGLGYLKEKKKQIIEAEAVGLLEFIESEHDLSAVSGHDFVKKRFHSAAKAIRESRFDVLPMGYLIPAPWERAESSPVWGFFVAFFANLAACGRRSAATMPPGTSARAKRVHGGCWRWWRSPGPLRPALPAQLCLAKLCGLPQLRGCDLSEAVFADGLALHRPILPLSASSLGMAEGEP